VEAQPRRTHWDPLCSKPIRRGLVWVASPKELGGGSLLDEAADVVWRKVGRREPGKLARYLQQGQGEVA